MPISTALETTLASEVTIQPMPTDVTLRPVAPSVLNARALDAAAGVAVRAVRGTCGVASAAAGNARPAVRKFLREPRKSISSIPFLRKFHFGVPGLKTVYITSII
jgi:hypothetical protein